MCTQCHLIEHFPTKTCDLKSDSCITEPSREREVPMLATHSNSRVTLQVLQYILVNSLDNPSITVKLLCLTLVEKQWDTNHSKSRKVSGVWFPSLRAEWKRVILFVTRRATNRKYKILFLASLQNRTCSEKILSYIQNKWKMVLLSQYI